MIEVSSEIKKLIAKRGVYGAVSIRLEYVDDPRDNELTFQAPEPGQWAEAIRYAFAYFTEKYRENGIKVVVTKVDSQAVDTSSILIVYLMLQCFTKATGFDTGVVFNTSTATVEFQH